MTGDWSQYEVMNVMNRIRINKSAQESSRYLVDVNEIPHLKDEDRSALRRVTDEFKFRATRYYLNLVDWDNPSDPIRRLIIPHVRELEPWGALDPSSESAVTVARGVQHKYISTVLLLCTETCLGFCRYCFRKRLFMNDNNRSNEISFDFQAGLDYVRSHPEVSNVLLTGGDPLALSTNRLEKIIGAVKEIPHVRIVRIGTKSLAFNPYRILDDPALIQMLRRFSDSDRRIYIMSHFDHVRELTTEARRAVSQLVDAGVICVNQNPICRGISDKSTSMASLWNELSYLGVQQYYVFQVRPTVGNKMFVVPLVEAYRLIEEAKKLCSGLGKRVRFVMSHASGKVEITGVDRSCIYLKYHQAKSPLDSQRMLICRRDDKAVWLDQLQPLRGYQNPYYRREYLGNDLTECRIAPN